jgi:glycosyltransferase involved in cell wall biosynthesis
VPTKKRITIVLASSLPPWSTDADLWHKTARQLAQDGCDVTCLAAGTDTAVAHLNALAERGVQTLFAERSEGFFDKLRRKLLKAQIPRVFRALTDFKPDLVLIWGLTPIDGLPWMDFCRNMSLRYSAVVETNSSIWWPDDSQADFMYALFSRAERVFFFSAANRDQLEMQLAQPIDRAEIIWDNYVRAPSVPVPTDIDRWAIATLEPLDPERNALDVLFRVLAESRWRTRPLAINVYGTSGSADTLRMLARRLDLSNVEFRGPGKTSQEIWSENHLLVHAARFEGFPGRLTEAMWHQRPAVVTELLAAKGLYEHGRTAFVAAAARVQLLDTALEEAWQRRYEWPKMGTAALAAVERLAPSDPVTSFCELLVGTPI